MQKPLKIVALIPARGGSKGIPGKNIKQLGGKPLIAYAIEATQDVPGVDETYVSTDSEKITDVAMAFGARVISRPKKYATDTASSELALLHFARKVSFDILVFLQCTSPFTLKEDIAGALDFFQKKKLDSLVTVEEDLPFLWNGKAKPINYDFRKRPRRQEREMTYRETGAFYITTRNGLLGSKNRLHGKIGLYVMPRIRSLEIDSPDDFLQAELAINFFKAKGGITFEKYPSHHL